MLRFTTQQVCAREQWHKGKQNKIPAFKQHVLLDCEFQSAEVRFFFFVHHCSLITDHCCLKQKLSLKWVETPAGWGRGGWSPHRSSSEKIEERTHFRDIPELRHHLWNRKDNGENTDRMNKSYRHVVRRLDSSSKFFTYYYYWAHDWVVRHLSREDGCGSQIQKSQVFRKI